MAVGKIFPLLFFLLCALLTSGMGFQQASNRQDLALIMGTTMKPAQITDSVDYMAKTVQSVKNLPSCYKVASAALLNSCSELDQSSKPDTEHGIGTMLEKAKSIYATRLAICELLETNVPIPQSCSPFKPTEHTGRMTGFRIPFTRSKNSAPNAQYQDYDDTTEKYLGRCTADLSLRPQWWTTYSNAKQSALFMCHAMRAQLEKDDSIDMFEMMADAVLKGSEGLSRAADGFKVFEDNWKITTDGMQAFHMAMNDDFEDLRHKVAQHWSEMQNDAAHLSNRINHMRETTDDIVNDLDNHLLENRLAQAHVMKGYGDIRDMTDEFMGLQDLSMAQLQLSSNEIITMLSGSIAAAQELGDRLETFTDRMSKLDDDANQTHEALLKVQEEVNNLFGLSSLFFGFGNAIIGDLLGSKQVLVFVITGSSSFACLDTWGPFRTRATTVLSLAVGFVLAYAYPLTAPTFMVLKDAFSSLSQKLYTPITPIITLAAFALVWAVANLVSRMQRRGGVGNHHLVDTKHGAPSETSQSQKGRLQFRLPYNDPKYFTQGKGAKVAAKITV